MAKSINLEPTSKGFNRMLDEMNATNVKLGETIDEYQYEEATSILLDKVNSIDPKLYQKSQDNNLATDNKTIVGAINELFQSASSGKQLIADAIGDDGIDEDSSFKAMSQAIRKLKTSTGSISGVKQIENNNENFFVLKSSGELYGCGRNANGELGLGDTASRLELTLIQEDVEAVYCGDYSTYIIKAEGDVYSCGKNDKGQLGIGNTSNALEFTLVPDMTNVKQIAGGPSHTLLVKNDGSLYACGSNESKQLGVELNTGWECTNPMNEHTILEGDEYYYWVLSEYSYFFEYEDNNFSQSTPETCTIINRNDYPITIVLTEVDDDMIPLSDYRFEVPANSFYKKTGMQSASATNYVENCLLTIDFYVSAGWSKDVYTEEAIQDALRNISVYAADVEVVQGRANETPIFTQVTDNINYDVKQVACGRIHSAILKNNDTVWSCGQNTVGQLGQGDVTECSKFTHIKNIKASFKRIHDLFGVSSKLEEYCELSSDDDFVYVIYARTTVDKTAVTLENNKTYYLKNDNDEAIEFYVSDKMGNAVQDVIRFEGNSLTQFNVTSDPIACAKLFMYADDWGTWISDDFSRQMIINNIEIYELEDDLSNLTNVDQISCGAYHNMIVRKGGYVYSCGDNSKGQLGISSNENQSIFVSTNISNAKQIECGNYSSFVVLDDGNMMSCGQNISNHLCLPGSAGSSDEVSGDGTVISDITYTRTSSFVDSGFVTLYPNYSSSTKQYSVINKCNHPIRIKFMDSEGFQDSQIKVAANSCINYDVNNSTALDQTASTFKFYLYAYEEDGWDGTDEEITNEMLTNIIMYEGTVALYPNEQNEIQFEDIFFMDDVYVDTNYDFLRFYSQPNVFETDLTYTFVNNCDLPVSWIIDDIDANAISFGLSSNEVKVVTIPSRVCDGEIYARLSIFSEDGWNIEEYNTYINNIIENTFVYRGVVDVNSSPNGPNLFTTSLMTGVQLIKSSNDTTFVLDKNNSLFGCGINKYGQLGLNNTVNQMEPVLIKKFESGTYKDLLYAALEEKEADVEASMDMADLINEVKKLEVKEGDIKKIACGIAHAVVLKSDGSLWSCGYNNDGELGLGDTTTVRTFTQVTTNIDNDVIDIDCGDYHTVAIKKDGTVWVTGDNQYNQLGIGSVSNVTEFTQISDVNENVVTNAIQVGCGHYTTMIVKKDGTLWGVGYDGVGSLGMGTADTKYRLTQVTNNINKDVKKVFCGDQHTIILKTDNSVWSTGRNLNGQLGLGHTTDTTVFTKAEENVKEVACGKYFTFIIKNDGTVWSCGRTDNGQTGHNTQMTVFTKNDIKDAKKVACGDYHTMIVKKDGTLWAIGDNYNGQLGTGDQSERSAFTKITNGINNDAKSVACGTSSYFTYVIKKDDTIMATGDNSSGQLGQNNTSVTISLKKVILPKPNALDPNSALSLDWLGTQEPCYFVSDVEGADYGFTFDGSSYYTSTNQGKHSTAAVCRLYIHNPTGRTAYLYCVNYGESNYDYGMISKKNTALDLTYVGDAESYLLKTFRGQQSANEVTVTLPEGSGWYYIKYRKDSSDNANYDSLSFRVGFSAPYANQSLDEPIIYTDTPKE